MHLSRLSCRSGIIAAAAALTLAGCTRDGPKTHTVHGKVVIADGAITDLAECYVECFLDRDSSVRASGRIDSDGSFALQILHQGQVVRGAPEGTYLAQITLSDENEFAGRKRRPPPIHPRFLNTKTSGLTLKVPTTGDVTFNVSRR